MKIFVGIDIAKLNHFAAAISSDGEIILEPFKFTNDADGFQLLIYRLKRKVRKVQVYYFRFFPENDAENLTCRGLL